MPADPDPRPAPPDPPPRVTAGEIAAFLRDLARHRPPAGDPTSHAALLARKAELFARIADQYAGTDPVRAEQALKPLNAPALPHHDTPTTAIHMTRPVSTT